MNNIEKLAIEHSVYVGTENSYTVFLFDAATLEAFAKAYVQQQSEPVGEYGNQPKSCTSKPMDCQCALDATLQSSEPVAINKRANIEAREDGVYVCDGDHHRSDNCEFYKLTNAEIVNLLTHPPASVPLEKYNKLLDAFKSARNTLEFANELGGPISDTIWHGEAQTLFDFMDSIIAEAGDK